MTSAAESMIISSMNTVYVRCEDLVVGFIGPFPSTEAAAEHIEFLRRRGDADAGRIITNEEFQREADPFVVTPEFDRNYQLPS